MKKEKLVELVLKALSISDTKAKKVLLELCTSGSNWIDESTILGLLTGDIEFKEKENIIDVIMTSIQGTDMTIADWVIKTANLDVNKVDKQSIVIGDVCNVGRFIAFSYRLNDDKWSYVGSINFDKIGW